MRRITKALAAAVYLGMVSDQMALAQNPPRPLLEAAQKLNSIAPQAVAQQTIRIGTYDGATKQFTWALEESYPPNLPAHKRADQGGYVKPSRVAVINSYNVVYEFEIRNKPSNFRLTLSNVAGNAAPKVATLSGNFARVTLSPPSFAKQMVRINQSGAPVLLITPHLREQLGGFVVPHLLVTIVYEPPGAKSMATYARTTSAGTVVSLGSSRSSGFLKTVQPDTLMAVFNKAVGAYLGTAYGPTVKAGWEAIGGLKSEEVTIITDTTFGESRASGNLFSITEEVWTRNDDGVVYPGQGDVYVVLRDVLFVYLALDGKIRLAPLAFHKADRIRAADLSKELPASVAQNYLALDPHFNPALLNDPARGERMIARGERGIATSFKKGAGRSGPRFRKVQEEECKLGSGYTLEFEESDYESSTRSRTTTQTTLHEVSGLATALSGGSGTTTSSVTFSSAVEKMTGTTVAPEIQLACDANEGEFAVEVYFDNLLGTFFTLRGAPLAAQSASAVQGNAVSSDGSPIANKPVTLRIGGRKYRTTTDENGQFRFRFRSIPQGSGLVRIGKSTFPVTYTGRPVRVEAKLDGAAADKAPAPGPVTPRPLPAGRTPRVVR